MRLEIVRDRAADLTVVEIIAAGLGEPGDRSPQIGLDEPVAFFVPAPAGAEKQTLRLRGGAQLTLETRIRGPVLRASPKSGDIRKDLEALGRESLRRPQHVAPGEPAAPEPPKRFPHAAHEPRHHDRLVTDLVRLARHHVPADGLGPSPETRPPRLGHRPGPDGALEVKKDVLSASGFVEVEVTRTSKPAQERVRHGLRKSAGYRRIDGVAARREDILARLGGRRLGAHHHVVGHQRSHTGDRSSSLLGLATYPWTLRRTITAPLP